MDKDKIYYVLLANNKALELYETSIEDLILSSNYDFLVYSFRNWNEVINDLDEWEHYRVIDKITYTKLHHNLCIKLRDLINHL